VVISDLVLSFGLSAYESDAKEACRDCIPTVYVGSIVRKLLWNMEKIIRR